MPPSPSRRTATAQALPFKAWAAAAAAGSHPPSTPQPSHDVTWAARVACGISREGECSSHSSVSTGAWSAQPTVVSDGHSRAAVLIEGADGCAVFVVQVTHPKSVSTQPAHCGSPVNLLILLVASSPRRSPAAVRRARALAWTGRASSSGAQPHSRTPVIYPAARSHFRTPFRHRWQSP